MPRQTKDKVCRPTVSISAVLYRSSVEDVKPLEDSVSEAVCMRRDLACGVEAYKVRKSICVGAKHVQSVSENETDKYIALRVQQYITSYDS